MIDKPKINKVKHLVTLGIVLICVIGIMVPKVFKKQSQDQAGVLTDSQKISDPKSKGDPKAPIHIIEYTDFQCPVCRHGAKFLSKYMKENPSLIYLQFRHYPLPALHPFAVKAHVYAECAAQQDKFWPFHDILFERSPRWGRSLTVDWRFEEIAEEVGLDVVDLKICVQDESMEVTVMDNKQEGQKKGAKATPTYFINGKMVVGLQFLQEELGRLSGKEKYENQ